MFNKLNTTYFIEPLLNNGNNARIPVVLNENENDGEYRNIMKKLFLFRLKTHIILMTIDKERHNRETVLMSLNKYNKLANEINNNIDSYIRKKERE